jgi:hypothetical protein
MDMPLQVCYAPVFHSYPVDYDSPVNFYRNVDIGRNTQLSSIHFDNLALSLASDLTMFECVPLRFLGHLWRRL